MSFFATLHIVKIHFIYTIYLLIFGIVIDIIYILNCVEGMVMENNTTNNITNPVNNAPVNGANPYIQRPAQPVQPNIQNAPQPGVTQQTFYTNYSKQPGAVAYNVPSYTPSAQQTPVYRSMPTGNTQSPSAIYNNAQNGNAPQYHYGNPTASGILNNSYLQEQQAKKLQEKKDSKTLRTLGNLAGFALVVCFLRTNFEGSIITLIWMLFTGLGNGNLMESMSFGFGEMLFLNLILSVFLIGGTFFGLHLILKKITDKTTKEKKYKSTIKLNAPKKPLKTLLLILVAFGGCMAANYIVSLIAALFSAIGIDSGYTSFDNPTGIADIILMFIGIAIIPPLIEEFSMRGVLMTSMQKYGNTFAIFASAFIFGLFHGNFTQIPFAFICGLFFAYITIATDSLWPAIIVHAMNNGMSCVSTVLMQYFDENTANMFYYISSIGGIVLGVIALIIYLIFYKKDFILKKPSKIPNFSSAKKFRKFMSSPGMIIATILYTFQAISMVIASSLVDLNSLLS